MPLAMEEFFLKPRVEGSEIEAAMLMPSLFFLSYPHIKKSGIFLK